MSRIRKYYIIFFIILFFSCSQLNNLFTFVKDKIIFQKSNKSNSNKSKKIKKDKKKKIENKQDKIKLTKDTKKEIKQSKVIIYIDKEYEKSFYGNLERKIIIKFLKSIEKKYKIEKIDSKFNPLVKNDSFILISDKNFNKLNKSRALFSEALYFLINKENENNFKYPESLKIMKVGINYNFYTYHYMNEINPITGRKNFEIWDNFKIYSQFSNMIEDFKTKKLDIIIINRIEYYKLSKILPAVLLFYIDIGKKFGYIYFKDKNLLKNFEKFIYKNKIKYDWIDFF